TTLFRSLLRSFRVEQRAGYINEPPARAYERSGDFEQVALERYETVKPGLVKPPACFRIPAPGAGAGAWSVHEHGVRPALPGGERLGLTARIEQDGLSDKRAGSLGTRAELRKPAAVGIGRDERAAVFHRGRQRERLPPCAGAKVDHRFARPCPDGFASQLAAAVLHFDQAVAVFGPLLDGRAVRQTKPLLRAQRFTRKRQGQILAVCL